MCASPDSSPTDRANLRAYLADIVGPDQVLTSAEDTIPYAIDGTAALKQRPLAVVFPDSTESVAACVKVCARVGLPIHARGSGTGLSGGSVPALDGVVICLNRLDRILSVDAANHTLQTQAGVITQAIAQAAEEHHLFYPPDPGSLRISTIGGNVAENSGGLRGLKYGVTRDYIMGITVVMADGRIARFGNGCVKDVAGYSMKDVFIGSEGTLGIITEVLLKLVPKPAARRTLLATFDSIESAAETVSAVIAANVVPCTLEFLDQITLRCVEDFAGIGLPDDAGALLLIETDGHPTAVEAETDQIIAIARKTGAASIRIAQTAEEAADLAKARRTAFSALARVRPTTILEDVTVPRSTLAEMVSFIAATADRHHLRVGTFGHMGDGNLHPTFLTDERDEDEMKRVHQALDEIVTKTLELGGTITGEHGIGLAKKPWLKQQLGDDSYGLMKQLKSTLDPHNRLNPGKIFD
jgi:glycolate oxidase